MTTDAAGPAEWGPRETDARDRAAELLRQAPPHDAGAFAMAWLIVEHGRQGDLLDRLTALLPAAEQAARLMGNPLVDNPIVRAAAGRRGRRNAPAMVNLTKGAQP